MQRQKEKNPFKDEFRFVDGKHNRKAKSNPVKKSRNNIKQDLKREVSGY